MYSSKRCWQYLRTNNTFLTAQRLIEYLARSYNDSSNNEYNSVNRQYTNDHIPESNLQLVHFHNYSKVIHDTSSKNL